MNTLLIDTHSSCIKVILKIGENDVLINSTFSNQASEVTMPLIINSLNKANLSLKNVDNIIVVNGPGSFTGVRIGVTICKMFAYLLNIKIRTITSIDLMKFSIDDASNKIFAIPDTKGYYFNDILNDKLNYLNKTQFDEYILKNKFNLVLEDSIELDYEKIICAALKLNIENPHSVNPVYIKEIDALK